MKKNLLTHLLAILVSLSSATALAFSKNELVVWVGGDKTHRGIETIGKQFEKDTEIKVRVEIPENLTDRFQQAAAAGEGPDIVLWAHDRYGEWAKSGLLAELEPSATFRNGVNAMGWKATSYKGKIYGYPIALEAISLIYNKDLIKQPPKTFEEMFDLDKTLRTKKIATILWDQANPYFSAPMIFSNGGYAFKETAVGFDTKNVGVNNAGAKKGAALLKKLIDESVLPRGTDYGVMDAKFNKGQAAMMITGPWAWSNLEKSGINYGVAPLPTINNSPARAFVGVWAAAVNQATPNKSLAKEFLESYLLSEKGLKTMNDDVPLGAVANTAFMTKLATDKRIEATYQNAINGLIMPNVPEMGKFWENMSTALGNITSGRQATDIALDTAAKRILN